MGSRKKIQVARISGTRKYDYFVLKQSGVFLCTHNWALQFTWPGIKATFAHLAAEELNINVKVKWYTIISYASAAMVSVPEINTFVGASKDAFLELHHCHNAASLPQFGLHIFLHKCTHVLNLGIYDTWIT